MTDKSVPWCKGKRGDRMCALTEGHEGECDFGKSVPAAKQYQKPVFRRAESMNTLREHNRKMRDVHDEPLGDPAGVACDKCGAEMRFEFGEPPGLVRCPECGYWGMKMQEG